MQSHSVQILPVDGRCKYWAKLVRANTQLPLPADIQGASDLPGAYLQRGDEELLPGDALFEGEANHHRRNDRGWTYRLTYVTDAGQVLEFVSGFSEQKAEMKANGLPPDLLKGSGDSAGMVRIVAGLRMGLNVTP